VSSWLVFALIGTGAGALYAAIALGMVLTYRGSGVVNFAQVAMATYPAFLYADLRQRGTLVVPILPWKHGFHLADSMPFWPAFLIALTLAALMGLLIDVLVFRPLATATSVTKVIASLGVNSVILGLMKLQYGAVAGRRIAPILPHGAVRIFGVNIDYNRFVLAAVVVAGGLVLWAVYAWTQFGLATRAAAESRKSAELLGLSPARLSSMNWMLASVVAGAVGILAGPIQGVSSRGYGVYLAYGLAAAMAARLRSFTMAAFAGIALGMFESMAVKMKAETWLPSILKGGFEAVVPFIVIVAVLLLAGTTLPQRGALVEDPSAPSPAPRFNPYVIGSALIAAVAMIMVGSSALRLALIETLVVSTLSLSFVLMAGFVGQVTLAELTFAGIAAFALARTGDALGLGFPWSPLLAIAIGTAAAAVLSFPAVRIRGLQLAVVTYSGALALEQVVFRNPKLTGVGGYVTAAAPSVFGRGFGPASGPKRIAGVFPYKPFCVFVLIVTVLCALLVANVRRSRVGRRLLAVRANERAAAACGVAVPRTKLLGATLGSFVASCAGVLWAYKYVQFNSDSFPASGALDFIALAFIGGITMVSGAFIAGFFASAGVFYALVNNGHPPLWYGLAYGVGLIVVTIHVPGGLAAIGPRVRRWRRRRSAPVLT
jgi:branched-chain amino acid transport system permease protein